MNQILVALSAIVLFALLAFLGTEPEPTREQPAYCMNHFGIPFGFDYPWVAMMLGQTAWRCDDLMHQRDA